MQRHQSKTVNKHRQKAAGISYIPNFGNFEPHHSEPKHPATGKMPSSGFRKVAGQEVEINPELMARQLVRQELRERAWRQMRFVSGVRRESDDKYFKLSRRTRRAVSRAEVKKQINPMRSILVGAGEAQNSWRNRGFIKMMLNRFYAKAAAKGAHA